MSAFEPSTQRDIKSPIQFVTEGITPATYGVTPENPAFTQALFDAALVDNVVPTTVPKHNVGNPDMEGMDIVRIAQDFAIRGKLRSTDEDFLRWAMSKPTDAVNTPDESKTLMFSEDIGGVTKWNVYKGTKPAGCNLTVPNAGYITAEVLGSYRLFEEITVTQVAALTGTGSRITASSGSPLTHKDTTFQYNGLFRAFRTITVSVAYDMSPVDSSGDIVDIFKRPTKRRITGSISLFKQNSLIQQDAREQRSRSANLELSSGFSLGFGGFRFLPSGEERTSEVSDSVIETKSFTADTLTVT